MLRVKKPTIQSKPPELPLDKPVEPQERSRNLTDEVDPKLHDKKNKKK